MNCKEAKPPRLFRVWIWAEETVVTQLPVTIEAPADTSKDEIESIGGVELDRLLSSQDLWSTGFVVDLQSLEIAEQIDVEELNQPHFYSDLVLCRDRKRSLSVLHTGD